MFLCGHLAWAVSFMFLITWRGYWQELIETLMWAHENTPLSFGYPKDKPVALSIVQARLVGLTHFTAVYITVSAYLGLSIFALTTFQGDPRGAYNSHSKDYLRPLRNKEDWFQLCGGILLGSMGGAIFGYVLLENFSDIDAALRGAVNVSQALSGAVG